MQRVPVWLMLACGVALGQEVSSVLTVESAALENDGKLVRLTVRNSGTKLITAFAVVTDPGRNVVTNDYFPSLGVEAALGGLGGIRPGQTASIVFGPPGSAPPKVVAVVFADRTAIGDEAQIDGIFERRAQSAAEMAPWCAALSADRLDRLIPPDLVAAVATIRRDLLEQGVADTFASLLDGVARTNNPHQIIEFLHARCAAAAIHSRRFR
jgi:hypothetical protein